MAGQVYIKRNANVTLIKTKTDKGIRIGFKMQFLPRARDIVPVSRRLNSKDVELAQYLKYLLKNNEKGIMGDVEIRGEVDYRGDSVPRPTENPSPYACRDLFVTYAEGSFLWLLCKLCPIVEPKIYLSNLFFGGDNQNGIASGLTKMEVWSTYKGEIWSGSLLFQIYTNFHLTPETWDALFSKAEVGARKIKLPKLTLVLCADLSERMAQPRLIIGPHGTGFRLTTYQQNIVKQRKAEAKDQTSDRFVIVARGGKELHVLRKYFVEASPVFQAMLENQEFEEGRTSRIQFPDIDDKLIECLIAYLYYFDISSCVNDLDLAIKMLEIAERFQLTELKSDIRFMLLSRKLDDFTIDQALDLFAFTRNLDHFKHLTRKVFRILKRHSARLQESQKYQEWFINHPKLAMQLFENAVG